MDKGEVVMPEKETLAPNFVENIVREDLKQGKHADGIHTRFPPE